MGPETVFGIPILKSKLGRPYLRDLDFKFLSLMTSPQISLMSSGIGNWVKGLNSSEGLFLACT